jgi:hypothetical protein
MTQAARTDLNGLHGVTAQILLASSGYFTLCED